MKAAGYLADKRGALTPTGHDIEGPFYLAGAPEDKWITPNPTLSLSGRVLDTHGNPVVGAVLDFWQADGQGVYDEHGFKFRGKQAVGADGSYELATITPGDYAISDAEFRCSHIHVKVWVNGVCKLTTQLYFDHSAHNDTDHWFSPFRVVKAGEDDQHKTFDFVI